MKAQTPATPRSRRPSKKSSAEGASALSAETTAPGAEALSGPAREEMIRLAAYSLYESRGSVGGRALDDWLEAEAMIDRAHAERSRGPASSH